MFHKLGSVSTSFGPLSTFICVASLRYYLQIKTARGDTFHTQTTQGKEEMEGMDTGQACDGGGRSVMEDMIQARLE